MKRDLEATFSELVEARLRELGENAFALEQKFDLPADSIRNVIRKDSKRARPNLSRIQEICEALDLEVYVGPKRFEATVPVLPINDEFARIRLVDAPVCAGGGVLVEGESSEEDLAFRRSWLKSIGLNPAKAVLARVVGESMYPSIHPRDLVLIDTSKREVRVKRRSAKDRRRGPLYALRDANGARIKRIERPEERVLILTSDNPAYPPEIVKDIQDLSLIGRVVWWGHTNKE